MTHGVEAGQVEDRSGLGSWAGLALLGVAAAFASWACFRQFGGYDLSPLIDAFWRVRVGQVPGQDFVNTFPLLIHLCARLAAPVDMGWYELTLVSIVLTFGAYAAIIGLTPPDVRSGRWRLAVAAILSLPLVYTNHVWHSSAAQLAGAVFAFALLRAIDGARIRALAWVALSAAFVAVSKQNLALPLLATALAGALIAGGAGKWRLAASIAGGAALGVGASLLILGMRVTHFVASYTAVLGRGLPGQTAWHDILQSRANVFVLSALAVATMVAVRDLAVRRAAWDRRDRLTALLLLAALCPLVTDWDSKVNDAVLPLFVVAAQAWARPGASVRASGPFSRTLALAILTIFAVALANGYTRERMRLVGPGAFWEPVADTVVPHGYFAGLHTGDRMGRVLREMEALRGDSTGRVFFGPRIEFGYRVTGTPSPLGLPLWWHPGSSYAARDEAGVLQAFSRNRFERLVFLGDDRTRMPPRLLDRIARDYVRSAYRGELEIYVRREFTRK